MPGESLWGPLRYRFFISQADRGAFTTAPDAKDADWTTQASEPSSESLLFGGPVTKVVTTPQLRPVFPGVMRFAIDPAYLLQATSPIIVDANGKITPASLAAFAGICGHIAISLVAPSHLRRAAEVAAIPEIGPAVLHAWYGPVRLTEAFLRQALLDHATGMLASAVPGDPPLVIQPGDPRWEKIVLPAFLAGNYQPALRAGAAPDGTRDDAARLAMPELLPDPKDNEQLLLNIAFGWVPGEGPAPLKPDPQYVELVPARAFLQHIAAQMIDIARDAAQEDKVAKAVFKDHYDSRDWAETFDRSLEALGFGTLSPQAHPIDREIQARRVSFKLREFQIVARQPFVAAANITEPAAAARDLRNLACAANAEPYAGAVSGMANQETRKLVASWAPGKHLRNPLLIMAIPVDSLVGGRPPAGTLPIREDLWLRAEFTDGAPRIFAANLSLLRQDGARFDIRTSEPIGSMQPPVTGQFPGGPSALSSDNQTYVPYPDAEFTPVNMLGIASSDLLSKPALAAQCSTFRVIRAVAEQECRAYLDEVNTYDYGYLSVGLFHWAAASAGANPKGRHELGGLLGYLKFLDQKNRTAGSAVFTDNGLDTSIDIDPDLIEHIRVPTGGMKYAVPIGLTNDRGGVRAATSDEIKEYLPSWRSFYRQVRAGRIDRDLAKGFYQMAKRRLRDLDRVRFPADCQPTDNRTHPASGRTLGSVFNTELLMALIMRWHVNQPKGVMNNDPDNPQPSQGIKAAYIDAAATHPQNKDAWASALLTQLNAQLLLFVKASDLVDGAQDNWPDERKYTLGRLLRDARDIERPHWITLGGPNHDVPQIDVANNKRRYVLDPNLRVLRTFGGSFNLDNAVVEPSDDDAL